MHAYVQHCGKHHVTVMKKVKAQWVDSAPLVCSGGYRGRGLVWLKEYVEIAWTWVDVEWLADLVILNNVQHEFTRGFNHLRLYVTFENSNYSLMFFFFSRMFFAKSILCRSFPS